jgi:putative transposase
MEAFATLGPQIGIAASCVALSINRAGIYRTRTRLARRYWCTFPRKRRARPPLAFSEEERTVLLLILNSERFADLAPAVVFAILLDEGRYHGSMRTMYRLLALEGQTGERRKQRVHTAYAQPDLLAGKASQNVWSMYNLLKLDRCY